jgi:uncharacterized protein (TIGR02145 family)
MKNVLKIAGLFLLIPSIILFNSCKKDKPIPPSITTSDVTAISYTTATSGGTLTNEGSSAVLSMGICWNTTTGPTIDNSKTTQNGALGAFVSNIVQLSQNTKYYVRAYATNTAGTSYGNEVTFTTIQIAVPVLTTAAIATITQTTAVSGGSITADNGGTVTARGVCWSTVTNPTTSDSKTSDGIDVGNFVSNLTGLIGNTTYFVRAYATNSAGTQYGNQVSFTTAPLTPTLTTVAISLITGTTCTTGGSITSDGGASVTVRGVCWSTSTNPTITDSKTSDGTGTGIFVSNLSGLVSNTTYYIRAYATNSMGTAYGDQQTFTSDPLTVTDVDGNTYNVIRIGTQLWMKENLKTTKYRNGDIIGTTASPLLDISSESTPEYQWAYDGNESNVSIYGRLYTWFATTDIRNVCPTGWHVPSDNEWTTLTAYLSNAGLGFGGNISEIAKSMASTSLWISDPTPGSIGNDPLSNNASGFDAFPSGARVTYTGGLEYSMMGTSCAWWASTELDSSLAWQRILQVNNSEIIKSYYGTKKIGVSVRCIKD